MDAVAVEAQELTSGAPADAAPAAAAGLLLDQKRDNRFVRSGYYHDWRSEVREGEYVVAPQRSGGSFDPHGCRAQDVWRADDLVAVCEALGGSWAFVTLTVNRSLFLSPAMCYERAGERVRKVAAALSSKGVWAACVEVQTKTGDGWPHWHLLVWVPGCSDPAHLLRIVRKRWTIRDWSAPDPTTGEMKRSTYSIGFVTVELARDRVGVGKYVAKYITKPWEAVPDWMLASTKRFRKLRVSGEFYNVLERLHRHVRHVGGRKERLGKLRPTRTLLARMSASGSTSIVFRQEAGRLRFVRSLNCPVDDYPELVRFSCGGRFVKLGKHIGCRVALTEAQITLVSGHPGWTRSGFRTAKYRAERSIMLDVGWEQMQRRRAEEEGGRAGLHHVDGSCDRICTDRGSATRICGRGREVLENDAVGVPLDAGRNGSRDGAGL